MRRCISERHNLAETMSIDGGGHERYGDAYVDAVRHPIRCEAHGREHVHVERRLDVDELVLSRGIAENAEGRRVLVREVEYEAGRRDAAYRIEANRAHVGADKKSSATKRLRALGEDRSGRHVRAHRRAALEAIGHA